MFNKIPELRDFSELDERLIPYFKSAERIEVVWKPGYEDYTGYGARTEGRVARFYVSLSSGWRPIFISVLQKNSFGGTGILSNAIQDIRNLGGCFYDSPGFVELRKRRFEEEMKLYQDNKHVFKPPIKEIIKGLNYHPALKRKIEREAARRV